MEVGKKEAGCGCTPGVGDDLGGQHPDQRCHRGRDQYREIRRRQPNDPAPVEPAETEALGVELRLDDARDEKARDHEEHIYTDVAPAQARPVP